MTAVARAALLGARGNSGVILSQIVRGAAEELASRPGELVDPVLVAAAFARAADAAYDSVRDPAEGTMLSAVRAMAHRVAQDLAHMDTPRLGPDATPAEQDELIAEVLERALDAAKEAVERGPEQLPVLKEAGVVDAGAYGLTVIVAGVVAALRGAGRTELAHQAAPAGVAAPARARVLDLPLLHQLRGHRRGPGRRQPSCPARGASATACSWWATSARSACTCTPTSPRRRSRSSSGLGEVSRLDVADMREQVADAAPAWAATATSAATETACAGRRRGQRRRASAGSTRSSARSWSTAARR